MRGVALLGFVAISSVVAVLLIGALASPYLIGRPSAARPLPTATAIVWPSPAPWPDRMLVEVWVPTATPRPLLTPRPTRTTVPSCPPAAPGYCTWPTPTRSPTVPTPIPTCGATPQPGVGCQWTRP